MNNEQKQLIAVNLANLIFDVFTEIPNDFLDEESIDAAAETIAQCTIEKMEVILNTPGRKHTAYEKAVNVADQLEMCTEKPETLDDALQRLESIDSRSTKYLMKMLGLREDRQ
jgi:hypothetical protein